MWMVFRYSVLNLRRCNFAKKYLIFQLIETKNKHNSILRTFSYISKLFKKNMPPKKVVKEEKILLGRPSNNLKIGVVGLPNVGYVNLFFSF